MCQNERIKLAESQMVVIKGEWTKLSCLGDATAIYYNIIILLLLLEYKNKGLVHIIS